MTTASPYSPPNLGFARASAASSHAGLEAARREELLGHVSLARLDYDRHAPEREEINRPRRFALLVALQAEVMQQAGQLAVCCNLANAMAAGIEGASMRNLIRNFPASSSRLLLATSRLRGIDVQAPVVAILDAYHSSTAVATQATVSLLRYAPGAALDDGLVMSWRRACQDSIALIATMSEEFQTFGLACAKGASPLQRALLHAVAGDVLDVAQLERLFSTRSPELRRWRRLEVSGNVLIGRRGDFHRVALRDLSGGGVGIMDKIGLTENETVIVRIDETIHMSARVAWASNGMAGIEFATPLYDDSPELSFLARRSPAGCDPAGRDDDDLTL